MLLSGKRFFICFKSFSLSIFSLSTDWRLTTVAKRSFMISKRSGTTTQSSPTRNCNNCIWISNEAVPSRMTSIISVSVCWMNLIVVWESILIKMHLHIIKRAFMMSTFTVQKNNSLFKSTQLVISGVKTFLHRSLTHQWQGELYNVIQLHQIFILPSQYCINPTFRERAKLSNCKNTNSS